MRILIKDEELDLNSSVTVNNITNPPIKIQRIWYTVAALIGASEAVVMSMVVSRRIGLEEAGELTIAFALGNLFRTVGLWGTRNFQVSDQKKEFSFRDYLVARIVSLSVMFFFALLHNIILLLFFDTGFRKLTVICLIELIYLIESFEDVIWGEYQRAGRLDIGSKMFIVRWGILMVCFILAILTTGSLTLSLTVSIVVSTFIFFSLLFLKFWYPLSTSLSGSESFSLTKLYHLLKKTTPLFLIAFLYFFLNNAAKYAIDVFYNENIQAYFGFITIPAFAVEMISGFVYEPNLTNLSILWTNKNVNIFRLEIFKQITFIILVTLVCLMFAWWGGIPILSLLFAVDLSVYRLDLLYVILSGGAISLIIFANVLLIIMRQQKLQLIIYVITTIIGSVNIWFFVKKFEIRGGTIGNCIAFIIQALALYIAISTILYKCSKKKNIMIIK